MPPRAASICRHAGCGRRIELPGYCAAHQADARQWDNAARAKARQSKRALPTNSTAWRRIRESVLRANPLCVECEKRRSVTPATVVDHIDGDAMNDDPSNWQGLCASCHSAKTARQDGGFGNRSAADRS